QRLQFSSSLLSRLKPGIKTVRNTPPRPLPPFRPRLFIDLLLTSFQVVGSTARATDASTNCCSLFAAGQRANTRARESATADNRGLLLLRTASHNITVAVSSSVVPHSSLRHVRRPGQE